jgi:hypothetical protein
MDSDFNSPYRSPASFPMNSAAGFAMSDAPRKTPWLGIASFGLSLLTGFGLFATFVVAGVIAVKQGGEIDENSSAAMLIGLAFIGGIFAEFVALGLGIGGLFQKDCSKIMSILGIVFSALALFGGMGILILGLMAG